MGPARLIQATGLLDSIIAQEARAADFCNTISPEADIELSCVNVAEEHRRGVSKSTFPAME